MSPQKDPRKNKDSLGEESGDQLGYQPWEERHEMYGYPGIPVGIHEEVLDVSRFLSVPDSELAEAFFQYCLNHVESGDLNIKDYIKPNTLRRTLFPNGLNGPAALRERTEEEPLPPDTWHREDFKYRKTAWTVVIGYHIQETTHQSIQQLSGELGIEIGDIATVFLKYGLDSYYIGRLVLEPQPIPGSEDSESE